MGDKKASQEANLPGTAWRTTITTLRASPSGPKRKTAPECAKKITRNRTIKRREESGRHPRRTFLQYGIVWFLYFRNSFIRMMLRERCVGISLSAVMVHFKNWVLPAALERLIFEEFYSEVGFTLIEGCSFM